MLYSTGAFMLGLALLSHALAIATTDDGFPAEELVELERAERTSAQIAAAIAAAYRSTATLPEKDLGTTFHLDSTLPTDLSHFGRKLHTITLLASRDFPQADIDIPSRPMVFTSSGINFTHSSDTIDTFSLPPVTSCDLTIITQKNLTSCVLIHEPGDVRLSILAYHPGGICTARALVDPSSHNELQTGGPAIILDQNTLSITAVDPLLYNLTIQANASKKAPQRLSGQVGMTVGRVATKSYAYLL